MRLGLDIGFGDVKIAYRNGNGLTTSKYPTAIHHKARNENPIYTTDNEYEFEGGGYVAGEAAKNGAYGTRSYTFLRKYAPVFAYIALKQLEKANGRMPEQIGIGLPLTYYSKENVADMEKRMRRFIVNQEVIDIPVTVYVQGYGVLVDYIGGFQPGERDAAAKELLVIDVGFNTVDIVNVENGKVTRQGSDTMENDGVSRMTEQIISYFRPKHFDLSPVEAAELLRTGTVRIYGQMEDHSELVREITEEYVGWLFGEIESRYGKRIKKTGKIILAGGGAYFLRHYIPAEYASQVYIPERPEMANARGFLRIMEDDAA